MRRSALGRHRVIYDPPLDLRGPDGGRSYEGPFTPTGLCKDRTTSSGSVTGGPCPPPGKPHRYDFTLYALDITLNLKPRATKAQVLEECKGHVLAEAQLMGRFGR